MSTDTSIRIDRKLKEDFEEKFEQLHGVKPQTSSLVEKTIKDKINELDEKLEEEKKALEAQKKKK